ncbi:MAG: DUF2971 domain-containing protein [Acholeplasma sp.]|nr:DUF2971 domain-containing protein [Acholeplasma sp.]
MKLYKYRSITNKQHFDYYLKSLSEVYLWFADIRSLNDPSDSMIYYDRKKEEELFRTYFSENQANVYRNFLKLIYKQLPQIRLFIDSISDNQLLSMADMMNNGDFDKLLYSAGATDEDIIRFEKAKIHSDDLFKQNEPQFKDILEQIFDFNDTYRHNIKVFSMSDSYDNDYLWKEYSEDYGFCIEYDSGLITDEMTELKDLNPVIYTDSRQHFSWLPLFLVTLQNDDQENLKKELEINLKNQLLSKGTIWSKEKEYRFFSNKSNIVKADIVTGIILHESILGTKEAEQLVKLCNDRKWKLSIWCSNEYELISYEENILSNIR